MDKRLAIVTTHPIQYHSPWFKLLAQSSNICLKVFFTWSQTKERTINDRGFGISIEWDIPLLHGFDYCFIENVSKKPGTHHFNGIVNPSLLKELNLWEPDVILIIGWGFNSHLKCLRYFHNKIPVLFRGDSTLINDKIGLKRIIRKYFLKWVHRKVDYALYVGKQNKLYYLLNGLKEKQLVFAPHAIDNSRFNNLNDKYKEQALYWRRQLGIKDDEIVFLFAGKLEQQKNPQILIEVFKSIYQPFIHLIFVGNGILEARLKKSALGIANCHFIDFQNQSKMPIVYQLGDVFILPSVSETWGLCVNEAMAAGRPVIVSDNCGCAVDLVEKDKNGYIFESNNKKDLCKKMELMMDKKKLEIMGKNSKLIIQNWSFENICLQIENILLPKTNPN